MPTRNPYFTGRESLLNGVHQALLKRGRAALSGLGGAGKTQTAIEYARRHRDEYTHLLWAGAASQEALISSYVALAGLLNLPEYAERDQTVAVKAMRRWLEQQSGWLLILDNADDIGMVRSFLPPDSGHVILTTRSHAMSGLAQKVEVETMDAEEGALLLLRRAGIIAEDATLSSALETDRSAAQEISEKLLDGLPLALDQAGAYLEETGCGLRKYVDLYRNRGPELLKTRGGFDFNHPNPVATTWALSFDNIEKTNPAAADLLRFCAFLDPDQIPEELFAAGAAELGPAASDELALEEALSEILKYSLMGRDSSTKSLEIHRLVQAVLRQAMGEATQRLWAERTVRTMNRALPPIELSTWPVYERVLPQANACAQLIIEFDFQFLEAGHLLNNVGLYLSERAQYAKVEPLYQRALVICEQALGPNHPGVATSLNNLGVLYKDKGQYAQAEPLLQRTLAIREQALGPNHPKVALSLNNLASLYNHQGRYVEAELSYRQALAIWEQALGPDHPDVARSLNNLATLYHNQGQYAQAEPLCWRALVVFEKALGPNHPSVATSLNNLAELYRNQGLYVEAEPLYRRALAIREQILGADHPNVANSLVTLAVLYKDQGQYAQAEPLYQRALAIVEKALGPEHPNTLTCIENYTYFLAKTGRTEQADQFRQRAAAIRAKLASDSKQGES